MPGTMCPAKTVKSPEIFMSQMCVKDTLIVIGLSVRQRFLTAVPFIIKIEIDPVSAIACDAAIAIAFAHSNHVYFFVQFDAITVALSSSYDNYADSWRRQLDWVG